LAAKEMIIKSCAQVNPLVERLPFSTAVTQKTFSFLVFVHIFLIMPPSMKHPALENANVQPLYCPLQKPVSDCFSENSSR
jgi:hypothetical protein